MRPSPDNALLDLRWMNQHGGAARVAEHLAHGLHEIEPPPFGVTLWGPADRIVAPAWCDVAHTDRVGWEWRGQRDTLRQPAHRGAMYLHQVRPLNDWVSATLFYDTIQLNRGSVYWRALVRVMLRTVARRSRTLVTISEYSRERIAEEFDIDVGAIERVHLPMDRDLARRVEECRARLETPGRDVLYVGRIDRHKNLDGLLRAFAVSGLDGDHRLHVFGADPVERAELQAMADSLGLRSVHIARDRSDDQLVEAYARAATLVLPSFVEGWGLTSYEAIACGIPVVANDAGAVREQAAAARAPFRLVDVSDVDQLAAALRDSVAERTLEQFRADSHAALADGPDRRTLAEDMIRILTTVRER